MRNFFSKRWMLFLVVLLFVIFKIPHLFYPYYWDESWVYAPAVMLMCIHGPSLLPNSIDVNYSRGHPLLFPALFAAWAAIFGHSHLALHSFALIISIAVIVSVYEIVLSLFHQRAAILSVLLLTLHMGFFAQSSFVLPDMLISLFVLLSLFFYASEKFLLSGFFLTLLFYTKESGLVVGVVLFADIATGTLKRAPRALLLKKFASLLIPLILVAVFFIIQKAQLGWYMNPEHIGIINLDIGSAIYWVRESLGLLFSYENKYLFFCVLLLCSVIAAFKKKNILNVILVPAAVFLYYLVHIDLVKKELPCVALIALFLFSVGVSWRLLKVEKYYTSSRQERFINICFLFLLVYVYFSSVNFFEARYLFPAVIVLLLLSGIFIDFFISNSYKVLYYVSVALIVIVGIYCIKNDSGDTDLGTYDRMNVQQKVVDYFEAGRLYEKRISASFLEQQHLINPGTGFLHSDRSFKNAKFGYDKSADFIILDNIDTDSSQFYQVKRDSNFHQDLRTTSGKAWAEIYTKKQ